MMQRLLAWLRWNLSSDNTLASWKERFTLLGLLVLCAGLWWSAGWIDVPAVTILIRGLVAVLALALMGPAGFHFFGPVLFYEMVRSARRSRYFFLRFLYALLLLFIFFAIFMEYAWRQWDDYRRAAEVASSFFETFMVVQLGAVFLLTPAYVAGSVAEEKERKTMEFLLATDLRNREIVLSKLLARLLYLSLFLLTGLPILGLIQFLGGVDPNLVLAGFVATAITMLGVGGLSMFNSVVFKKARDAITATYLMLVAYYVLASMAYGFFNRGTWAGDTLLSLFGTPVTYGEAAYWLNRGNLFVVVGELAESAFRAGGIDVVLWRLLQEYLWFYGILGLVTITYATLRVRLIALRQAYGQSRQERRWSARRPPVGDLPMLWKEVHVEGGVHLNLVTRIVMLLLFLGTVAPAVFALGYAWLYERGDFYDPYRRHRMAEEMNIYVRSVGTGILCLYWLGLGIRAAGAISGERDRKTLDDLLTTPLEGNNILWAKLWGTLLSIRIGWIWPGIVWLIGLVTGGLHFFALPLVLAAFFVFAAFFTMLGLLMSIVCKTTARATVYTVMWTIGIAGGHWIIWMCCTPLIMWGGPGGLGDGRLLEVIASLHAGITPPAILAILPFSVESFYQGEREYIRILLFCVFGLFAWAIATVLFWLFVLVPAWQRIAHRQEAIAPDEEWRDERRPRRRPPPLAGEVDD